MEHSPGYITLCQKTSGSKFKNVEITPSMFSGHDGVKLKSITEEKPENSQIWGN